jgi:hypothetical protein
MNKSTLFALAAAAAVLLALAAPAAGKSHWVDLTGWSIQACLVQRSWVVALLGLWLCMHGGHVSQVLLMPCLLALLPAAGSQHTPVPTRAAKGG